METSKSGARAGPAKRTAWFFPTSANSCFQADAMLSKCWVRKESGGWASSRANCAMMHELQLQWHGDQMHVWRMTSKAGKHMKTICTDVAMQRLTHDLSRAHCPAGEQIELHLCNIYTGDHCRQAAKSPKSSLQRWPKRITVCSGLFYSHVDLSTCHMTRWDINNGEHEWQAIHGLAKIDHVELDPSILVFN